MQVLGQNKGVCRDDVVGGYNDYQLHTFNREDGINTITYRRMLISADSGDKEYALNRELYVIWAMGRLDSNKEPAFHDVYPKKDLKIHFNSTEPYNDCFGFAKMKDVKYETWERPQIVDKAVRSFTATLGPSGGKRGYQGITGNVLFQNSHDSFMKYVSFFFFRSCIERLGLVHKRILDTRAVGETWTYVCLQSVRRQ